MALVRFTSFTCNNCSTESLIELYFLGKRVWGPEAMPCSGALTFPSEPQYTCTLEAVASVYLYENINGVLEYVASSNKDIRAIDIGDSSEVGFNYEGGSCQLSYAVQSNLGELTVTYLREIVITTLLFIRSFVLLLFRPVLRLFGPTRVEQPKPPQVERPDPEPSQTKQLDREVKK